MDLLNSDMLLLLLFMEERRGISLRFEAGLVVEHRWIRLVAEKEGKMTVDNLEGGLVVELQ